LSDKSPWAEPQSIKTWNEQKEYFLIQKMFLSLFSRTLKVIPNLRIIPAVQLKTTPHQSAPLPALLVLLAKPLSAASAALLGRSFRIAWSRTSSEKKRVFKSKWRKRFCLTGVLMSGCAWYGYSSHVLVCPHTGRRKFVALSSEQVTGK
jgi:hypothetical protein